MSHAEAVSFVAATVVGAGLLDFILPGNRQRLTAVALVAVGMVALVAMVGR